MNLTEHQKKDIIQRVHKGQSNKQIYIETEVNRDTANKFINRLNNRNIIVEREERLRENRKEKKYVTNDIKNDIDHK